jgi:hypothetical protein
VGSYSRPTFADLDYDGDLDALVGAYDGTLSYFCNTGPASAPVFVQQTGTGFDHKTGFIAIDKGRKPELAGEDDRPLYLVVEQNGGTVSAVVSFTALGECGSIGFGVFERHLS